MKTVSVRFSLKATLFVVFSLMLTPVMVAHAGVVSGSFVYTQESDGSLIQYHVDAVDYQGVPAWKISWDCAKINAEHFVRRSDGKPLYVKRINHSLNRTVEINYSLSDDQPSIYRKRSANEFVERKIWDKNLSDLGVLPQLLMGFNQSESHSPENVSFSAINYDDGKVYPLIAKQSGFRNVMIDGERVHCAIYNVKLDSWLASFVGKTRILIPQQQSSNFVAYSGPSLDGSSADWSLRLVGKNKTVAMLDASEFSQ